MARRNKKRSRAKQSRAKQRPAKSVEPAQKSTSLRSEKPKPTTVGAPEEPLRFLESEAKNDKPPAGSPGVRSAARSEPAGSPKTRSAARRRQRQRTRRRQRLQQVARRSLLSFVLIALFVIPLSQLEAAKERGQGLIELGVPPSASRAAASLPGATALASSVSGSVWSIALGGVEVVDPLAAAITAVATHGGLLLTAALLPLLLTVLLGRVFCGWICPARLPVELAAWLRRRLLPERAIALPWLRWVKYGVLLLGLLVAAAAGWSFLPLLFPPAIFEREAIYLICYGLIGWGAVVLLAAFVADLVIDRGAWCRGLCPGGALYSLLGRGALLQIEVDRERCTSCGRCQERCPLGVDPSAGSTLECDRCGMCRAACKSDALNYRVGLQTGARERGDG